MGNSRKIKHFGRCHDDPAGGAAMLFSAFAGYPGLLLTLAGCKVGRILQIKQALSLHQWRREDDHPAMLFRTFAIHITLNTWKPRSFSRSSWRSFPRLACPKMRYTFTLALRSSFSRLFLCEIAHPWQKHGVWFYLPQLPQRHWT